MKVSRQDEIPASAHDEHFVQLYKRHEDVVNTVGEATSRKTASSAEKALRALHFPHQYPPRRGERFRMGQNVNFTT